MEIKVARIKTNEMKEVKSQKRYKCDFCKRRSTKSAMELHEKRCFRNPNRFCELCQNKGYIEDDINGDGSLVDKRDCPYCSTFDSKQLKEIETREKALLLP
jgi:hypothetical protein